MFHSRAEARPAGLACSFPKQPAHTPSLQRLLTLTATWALAASAHAASIAWDPATNTTANTDVSTVGTLVGAANLGPFPSGTTVNGVAFPAWDTATSSSSGIFSIAGNLPTYSLVGGAPPFSNLTSAYQSLLNDGASSFGVGGRPDTLTLSGLIVGNEYQLQLWSADPSGSAGLANTSTITAGNSITLDQNLTNAFGGLGQYTIGTFIANAATQNVTFNSTAVLSGVQLRQTSAPIVPEPGTALFGLALLGAALTRRTRAARRG